MSKSGAIPSNHYFIRKSGRFVFIVETENTISKTFWMQFQPLPILKCTEENSFSPLIISLTVRVGEGAITSVKWRLLCSMSGIPWKENKV